MKILVCDDLPDRCEEIAGRIRESTAQEPTELCGKNLTEQLEQLFKDISTCMNKPEGYRAAAKYAFDDVDVLVIDNNLAHLQTPGTRLTAESIAGYIRAFTNAAYIVSLNKNPDVDFDLRYLVGDYSTRADLALNDEHLGNVALWSGKPADAESGFRPWYWPSLSTVAERRRRQIEFVLEHLDESIVKTMGFDEGAIEFLSLHAKGALSAIAELNEEDEGEQHFSTLTFRQVFLAMDRSLPSKNEREALSEAEMHGNKALRDVIARIVAADIDLWFRRDIVGPQEPLIDIPHLIVRFPFLLGNRANNMDEWNKSIMASEAPYGLEERLYDDYLADRKFKHEEWVPSPCFWWPKLKADEELNDYFLKDKATEWADLAFCEDRSAFLHRTPQDDTSIPLEFPAEFESSWERRYVSRIEGVKYAPRSRLAM